MQCSEFSDEYQDWLEGAAGSGVRRQIFDHSVMELRDTHVVSVAPTLRVVQVVRQMNDQHVGSALVMQRGTLTGIFTERDLLTRVVGIGLDASRLCVGDVMTPSPETIPDEASIACALRTMVLGGFRHIPVVDGLGFPVAVISMRRVIHFVSEQFAREVLNAPPVRQSWPATAEGG